MGHNQHKLRSTWIVLGLCLLLTLPWTERNPFHTKGEPREAITAQAMIATGNWILPERYGDDEATKPPLSHWLMSLFSMAQGQTTVGSTRLHSVLSYSLLAAFMFYFLTKRFTLVVSVTATLTLLLSYLFIQQSNSARVDMLLTALMVIGMLRMFRWYEKQWKGIPWGIALLLGLAALTKGPVGIVLPCFVYGSFLLTERVPLLRITRILSLIALPAAILPALWYIAAYMQEGEEFLRIVLDENLARFSGSMTIGGTHEHSLWYLLASFFWGWIPWSLLSLIIFGVACPKWFCNLRQIGVSETLKREWHKRNVFMSRLSKFEKYSVIAVCCILFFYAIPQSKRDVYLMPAYPFMALLLARLFLSKTHAVRTAWSLFSWGLSIIVGLLILTIVLVTTQIITPELLISMGTANDSAAYYTSVFARMFETTPWLDVPIILLLGSAWLYHFYGLIKKSEETEPLATTSTDCFGPPWIRRSWILLISLVLFLNATLLPTVGEAASARPFAEKIKSYQIPTSELFYFRTGFYGLSFYLDNRFEMLERYMPDTGYVLVGEKEWTEFETWAQNKYLCHIETASPNRHNDMRQRIFLIHVQKIAP